MLAPNMLTTALSGLTANATRVAQAADNIANMNTVGYKAGNVQNTTLVTRQTFGYAGGGVQTVSRPGNNVQGLLQASVSPTDLAISGEGFFAVSPNASGEPMSFTRSGSFKPDNEGYLVNAQGYYLLGHPTDAKGRANTQTTEAINVGRLAGTAEATEEITLASNLPATAANGDSFSVTAEVIDSLGNALSVDLTFTKSGTNRYTLTAGDLEGPGGPQGTVIEGGSGPAYAVDVFFNADGTLKGFDADQDGTIDSATAPNMVVEVPGTGAADLSIALNAASGTGNGGLTQFGDDFVLGTLSNDGAEYGHLDGLGVGTDGTVTAFFSNGQRRPIANIPLATFGNVEGLEAFSGNVFGATEASGDPVFGGANAGSVQGGALELSTTDLATEIVNLTLAKNAYKASAKVIATADDMAKTLFKTLG